MLERRINTYPCQTLFKDILKGIPKTYSVIVNNSYYVRVDHKWAVLKRRKKDFFMVYVIEGKVQYELDEENYEIGSGEVFFIGKGVRHSIHIGQGEKAMFISIHFDVHHHNGNAYCSELMNIYGMIRPDKELDIESYFKEVKGIDKMEAWKKECYGNGIMTQLLYKLMECCHQESINKAGRDSERLYKIKKVMEETYLENYSVEYYAGELGITRKHFTKLFNSMFGYTPKSYLMELKMEYASYLLYENNMLVKDVALYIGYSDPYIFSKQYKKIVGVSPNSYKRR